MSDDPRRFQTLLRQLQEGSHEAAKELAETYAEHVLRCVRSRLPNRMRRRYDSLDFVQLVWISVFTEPEKFAQLRDADQFVRFLAGVAKNKVAFVNRELETRKKNLKREVLIDDQDSVVGSHPASRDPTPSSTASFREQWEKLVEQQSPRDGQVVEMRFKGNTFVEIAESLDIDEATARKIIQRLKKRKTAVKKPSSKSDSGKK